MPWVANTTSAQTVPPDSGWGGLDGEGGEDARRERIMESVRSLVRLAAEQAGIALSDTLNDLTRCDRRRLTQAVFKLASAAK